MPDDGFPIRAEDYLPDIAVDPTNGDVYVAVSDGLGTPIDKVVMAKSTDGGQHWSGPTVGDDGPTVQSYNHHRGDGERHGGADLLGRPEQRPGRRHRDDGRVAAHSHTGAATWSLEQHLYGPFNHYLAPISFFEPGDPRGLFLGDYMGLETITGNSVINFFSSTVTDGADVHSIRANHPGSFSECRAASAAPAIDDTLG